MRPKSAIKEDAIKAVALQMIADEGLENLSMQKLAKAANISPRTIYIKYNNKEDLLVKLFIEEVLGAYEKAILENFSPEMGFDEGVELLWRNGFTYLTNNRHAFSLIQYGKSSPLLNKAYQAKNIKEGDYFKPVHEFLSRNVKNGTIPDLPSEVHRALLFSPVMELANEYYDSLQKPKQIITETMLMSCCAIVIKGMRIV